MKLKFVLINCAYSYFTGGQLKSTKKTVEISDNIISRTETELIGATENGTVIDTENKLRKRTKHKPAKDVDRTLMISKEPVQTGKQTGSEMNLKTQTGSSEVSNKNQPKTSVQSSDNLEINTGAKSKVSSSVKGGKGTSREPETLNHSSSEKKEGQDSDLWSQNQQVILEWALRQYPKGTDQRWEKVADHIPGKNKVRPFLFQRIRHEWV